MPMALPNIEHVRKMIASGGALKKRILSVAKRLEALNEYHPEQALIVAADIVMHSLGSRGLTEKGAIKS